MGSWVENTEGTHESEDRDQARQLLALVLRDWGYLPHPHINHPVCSKADSWPQTQSEDRQQHMESARLKFPRSFSLLFFFGPHRSS